MCTKEELEYKIFTLNQSYESIGREYGVTGTTIKNWAYKLGIELKYRRSINKSETFNKGKHIKPTKECICLYCGKHFIQNINYDCKFCSTKCSSEYRNEQFYTHYLEHQEEYLYDRPMGPFKKFILREQQHKCAICGITDEWNGKKLVFVLDHIDGRAKNNRRENLRLVCPNCDSQLDTYKSKNKNSDRTYHKRYYNQVP